jgi:hypothetical protein
MSAMTSRRIVARLLASLLMFSCLPGALPAQEPASPARPLRVLFVGNSYTFFSNMPAVFSAVGSFARPDLPTPQTEMVVAGAATLDDLLGLPGYAAALRRGPWDAVVLQERGGVLACLVTGQRPLPTDCATSVSAHRKMIRMARDAGVAKVLLFGTWQMGTREAGAASRGTRVLAGRLGVPALDIGAMLFRAQRADPSSRWFTEDDHPHRLGSLLIAAAFWSTLAGEPVPVRAFEAQIEDYTGQRVRHGRKASAPVERGPTYRLAASAQQMQVIVDAIAAR